MSALRSGLSSAPRRILTPSSNSASHMQPATTRLYTNGPYSYQNSRATGTGSIILVASGTATMLGMGLYMLSRDNRMLQHNDHIAQNELGLNPKKKYRDSTSTRWVDYDTR